MTRIHFSGLVFAAAIAAAGSAASGMTFSNSTNFVNAVGGSNLTTFDFEGIVIPPATEIVVTQLDGVTFTTDGSDVILVTDDGLLQNAEQDRDLLITFPQPAFAAAVSMQFLDFINDPSIGGTISGHDGNGMEVFSVAHQPGSFFFGYFDVNQPITTLLLQPDGGGRSVVDELQYAAIPEPSTLALLSLATAAACGSAARLYRKQHARGTDGDRKIDAQC